MITNARIQSAVTTQLFLSSGENAITTIFFCNTSAVDDAEIDLYVVPAAGTYGTPTQVMSNLQIPAGETFVFDMEKLVLEDAAAIWAKSSVDLVVTATISSVKIS